MIWRAGLQALLLVALLAAGWLVWWVKSTGTGAREAPQPAADQPPAAPAGARVAAPTAAPAPDTGSAAAAATEPGEGATAEPAVVLPDLAAAAAWLAAADPAEATAWLLAWLASGIDAPSGAPLRVDAGGRLASHPSLRVFLLDWLGRIDPAAAANLAAQAFARDLPASADAFALHLRNYAWGMGTEAAAPSLRAQVARLLRHEPWRQTATAGFLEAFDVAVAVRAGELAADFAGMLDPAMDPGTRHAAHLALDRLVLADPAATLALLRDPRVMPPGTGAVRAGYFARGDPDDPAQRALLEAYLGDPAIAAAEHRRFLELLPNLNLALAYGLLTEPQGFSHPSVVARLAAAADWLDALAGDPRWQGLTDAIAAARERLQRVRGED